jgi:hypothetical protein
MQVGCVSRVHQQVGCVGTVCGYSVWVQCVGLGGCVWVQCSGGSRPAAPGRVGTVCGYSGEGVVKGVRGGY